MCLPNNWLRYLRSFDKPHVFASELLPGEVVTFVAEAKCKDTTVAQRQLTLDLCSAQHQRRALGFDDAQVFGATIVDRTLSIYCSAWKNDIVVRIILYPSCLCSKR